MTPEQWAALISAAGVGAVLPKLFDIIAKAIGGKVGRERDGVAYERKLRQLAEDDADKEATKRRKMQEYASQIRIIVMEECGVAEHRLPPWPEENTIPRVRDLRGTATQNEEQSQ